MGNMRFFSSDQPRYTYAYTNSTNMTYPIIIISILTSKGIRDVKMGWDP